MGVLKERTKSYYLEELTSRMAKMPNNLGSRDFERVYTRSIAVMNKLVSLTRAAVINRERCVGSGMYDISDLHVDVVAKIWYAPTVALSNNLLPGIGLLPLLIPGASYLSSLNDLIYLTNVMGNINSLSRQLQQIDDFELMPMMPDGKRFMQLRAGTASQDAQAVIFYLPYLDEEAISSYLYSEEDVFLKDYMFFSACIETQQYIAGAEVLGVAPPKTLDYWKTERDTLVENFKKEALVYALF